MCRKAARTLRNRFVEFEHAIIALTSTLLCITNCNAATTCFAPEMRPDAPLACAPYRVFQESCPVCGDGVCDPTESCDRCPVDCSKVSRCASGETTPRPCGNGICDSHNGENCRSCPIDCGPCVFVGPYRFCEPRDPPVMALTFDDGPTPTTTKVLELLREFDAKATFFNIAQQATNPLAKQIIAEGHVIGGHTYGHTELTSLLEREVLNDTLMATKALEELLGRMPKYMRPPFGRMSWSTPTALEQLGTKVILWSGGVWPETPDSVLRNARSTMESGRSAIFMFHGEKNDDGAEHADMSTLRGILKVSKELGVRLVNMTECLGDYLDGAWKSDDGSCIDDGCLCSGTARGLPFTADSVCYKGDLTNIVQSIQHFSDGVPDQCQHDPAKLNRRDLLEFNHYWTQTQASASEVSNLARRSQAEKAELQSLQGQLHQCLIQNDPCHLKQKDFVFKFNEFAKEEVLRCRETQFDTRDQDAQLWKAIAGILTCMTIVLAMQSNRVSQVASGSKIGVTIGLILGVTAYVVLKH